nr:hypothetical protein [Haladaptatus sp. AB618]
MTSSRNTLFVVLVATLLVASAVVGTGLTTAQSEQRGGSTVSTANGSNANANSTNVTVPRHENPKRVRQKGNSEAVKRWLRARLARRLGGSMVQVKRGQYEKAHGIVGDRFSKQLGQYVEVQRSTRSNGSENDTDQFRQGAKSQRKFIDAVREYRKTYRQYRKARKNGNTKRARQRARKLNQLAERTNQSSVSLKSTYWNVSRTTPVDLNRSSRQVTTISRNVSRTQEHVEETVFERTKLDVHAASKTVSFLDPMTLTGVLTTENGSAISNRNVTFNVGNRTIHTRTNDAGRFHATYRPTMIPLDTTKIPVEYRPLNQSSYLGATDTVNAEIRQVDSRVRLRRTPNRTGFGQPMIVSGVVGAGGRTAGSVPVVVSVGNQRIGTATTGPSGRFKFQTRLPSAVPTGKQRLRATVALSHRALSSSNTSRSVFVERTNTSLSIHATRNGSRVAVHGRLRANNSTAGKGRVVALRVNGNRVAHTKTKPNGSYETTMRLPSSVKRDDDASVVAVFNANASNLDGARASARLEGTSSSAGLLDWISLPWAGAALLTLVLLFGTVLVRERWMGDGGETMTEESVTEAEDRDGTDEEDVGDEADANDERTVQDELDAARSRLASGEYEPAVEMGYATVRTSILRRYDLDPSATPREFRREAMTTVSDREYRVLDDLTAYYERVVFASEAASADSISGLLDDVGDVVPREHDEEADDDEGGTQDDGRTED